MKKPRKAKAAPKEAKANDATDGGSAWYLKSLAIFIIYFNTWRMLIRRYYISAIGRLFANKIESHSVRTLAYYLSFFLLALAAWLLFQQMDSYFEFSFFAFFGPAVFLPVLLFYFLFSLFALMPMTGLDNRMHVVNNAEILLLGLSAFAVWLNAPFSTGMVVAWVVSVGERNLEKY